MIKNCKTNGCYNKVNKLNQAGLCPSCYKRRTKVRIRTIEKKDGTNKGKDCYNDYLREAINKDPGNYGIYRIAKYYKK